MPSMIVLVCLLDSSFLIGMKKEDEVDRRGKEQERARDINNVHCGTGLRKGSLLHVAFYSGSRLNFDSSLFLCISGLGASCATSS